MFTMKPTIMFSLPLRRIFLCTEAAVRVCGATKGGKIAEEWYEIGVRTSFAEWAQKKPAITDAVIDAYLNDDTSTPLDWNIDNRDAQARNDYQSRYSTITKKWNDADSPELKLEKIMMQKWIAMRHQGPESWTDFRRTGYPKFTYIKNNASHQTPGYGVIPNEQHQARRNFVLAEYNNNPEGVKIAAQKLNDAANGQLIPGASLPSGDSRNPMDNIVTPLWIHSPWRDKDTPNNNL